MTDNPYAAPKTVPHAVDVFEHIKVIRKVAKIFRILGWLGITLFAPLCAIATPLATWNFFHPLTPSQVQHEYRAQLESDYIRAIEELHRVVVFLIGIFSPALVYLSWRFLRTAKGLLEKSPRAYGGAIVYSWMFVAGFPLFTWLGIFCLKQLRDHWQLYCLQAPDSTEEG